jgi:hypothetical protein
MKLMDEGVFELMKARRDLDEAHKAACAAMARFQSVKCADIATPDERIAARSLLDQTVPLCKAILCAMQDVPDIARPKGARVEQKELLPLRTAASMLRNHKSAIGNRQSLNRGVVATSARHGRPILTAISCLLLCALPMTGKADTVERVIDALVQIESSGRPAVIGDGGKAVGLLQLHPVAVREANRIAGSNRWKLSDRFCPQQSRAMARTILTWHYQRGVTDPVELACRWNKPFGQTTAHYRAKVRIELAKI